ncbi:class I SAM-dependent methyltransferase (plasmid) [Paraburkholderia strydomiana]
MAKNNAKGGKGRAAAVIQLDRHRREYAGEWEVSSANLDDQGCYAWMAGELGVSGRVLENGCGTGLSTLALLRAGNRVVSVDENPACIKKASARLEAAGFSVNVQLRGEEKVVAGARIEIDYARVKAADADVILIEGNVLHDTKLMAFLADGEGFDAVVCWLMGTHSSMRINKCVRSQVTTSKLYRLQVQNLVYEMSDRVLRPGGTLQVVDRGEPASTPELVADFLDAHRDQASVTSLMPIDLTQRSYVEAEHDAATQMVLSPGITGRVPDLSGGLALISVRSVKPAATLVGDAGEPGRAV